jgi:hypothetical protein
MFTRDYKPRKSHKSHKPRKSSTSVIRMDPDCAICGAPATMACECEAKSLEVAIKHAEHRMMQSIYNDIRFVATRRSSSVGPSTACTNIIPQNLG